MPFTFFHPAIVMPFRKIKYFSLTALIIGSMIPDFEYYLHMRLVGHHGHTFWGIFYFYLPLGLILTFIFHYFIRNSLIEHLPNAIKFRFYFMTQFDWRAYFCHHYFIVITSLLIGIMSHLLWDAFTHKSGYFIERFAVFHILINNIPLYRYLQHISSFIGLLILIWIIYHLPKNKIPTKNNIKAKNYWVVVSSVACIIAICRFLIQPNLLLLGHLIVTSISSLFIGLIIGHLYHQYQTNK